MAEQKVPAQPAPAKAAPAPVLGSAGASSNPLVHQLLAERIIMASVDDTAAVAVLDGKLAGLGVSVEV